MTTSSSVGSCVISIPARGTRNSAANAFAWISYGFVVAAAQRGHGVRLERPIVLAPRVPELVREREPLARTRLLAVDPQHRAVIGAVTRAGDGFGQRDDRHGEARLHHAQKTLDGRSRIEPERGPSLSGALGATVDVDPGH